MANNLQEYRSQIFQISGFALMSPLGKFILDLKDTELENMDLWYFICLLIAFVLFCFGIISILKGEKKLEELIKKYHG